MWRFAPQTVHLVGLEVAQLPGDFALEDRHLAYEDRHFAYKGRVTTWEEIPGNARIGGSLEDEGFGSASGGEGLDSSWGAPFG